MNEHTQASTDDIDTLAENARALMAATTDAAGEKVRDARKRLASALESIKDKTIQKAKVVDKVVREHPYQAIAIGVGVGAIFGFLLARRCGSNRG